MADVWDACTTTPAAALVPADLWGSEAGGPLPIRNAGGTIERCEAPSLLAVTWEYGGEISWVEVQLSRSQQGAVLQRRTPPSFLPNGGQSSGQAQSRVGWDTALYGLGLHLASGKAIDPAEAQAWMASPEGSTS